MSLKTVTLRRLECDAAGCDAKTDVTASDAVEARFEAREAGWSYQARAVGGRGPAQRFDYCPAHAGEAA